MSDTNENKQQHVGLLLGSFNPVHIGHLVLAEMALERCDLDSVWFIVSPMNPDKVNGNILINEEERFKMVKLATAYNKKFHASNIEFSMPRPSFTNNTLRRLRSITPNKKFYIICGTDTHFKIPTWRNAQEVIDNHDFILHKRGGSDKIICQEKGIDKKTILLENVPVLEISSTFIREQIRNNKTLKHLLPEEVLQYIKKRKLYK
jgi:nicotinate-nucleotide adenylyltransferase